MIGPQVGLGDYDIQSMNRHFCSATVLVLVICLGALSLHDTTHLQADVLNCELCSGQADLNHGISPPAGELLSDPLGSSDAEYLASDATTSELSPYQPRAPPAFC